MCMVVGRINRVARRFLMIKYLGISPEIKKTGRKHEVTLGDELTVRRGSTVQARALGRSHVKCVNYNFIKMLSWPRGLQ